MSNEARRRSEPALHAMANAIRELLGLEPIAFHDMHAPTPREVRNRDRHELERFYVAPPSLPFATATRRPDTW